MGYRVRVSAGGVTFNAVVQSKLSSGDVLSCQYLQTWFI